MDLYEKIKNLASTKKISIRQLEEKLGFGNGIIRRWSNTVPGIDKIGKVADYFDVSTDYLLGRTEYPNGYYYSGKTLEAVDMIIDSDNEDFMELIGNLPALDENELKVVNDMVKSLVALKQKKS